LSCLVRDAVLKPCAPLLAIRGRMLGKKSRLSSGVLRVCCLPLGVVSWCSVVSWSGVVAFLTLYRPS
jgi:hypothetical protein